MRTHWRRIAHIAIDVRPLRLAQFRRLWAGQAVSFLGFQVSAVAVPVQIYAITHSSLWVGLVGLVGLLPLIGFGLWGGALADALDRRRLILISSLVTWTSTGGLLAQAVLHVASAPLILLLVAVQSAGVAVSGPARSAIIPRLVPTEQVAAANTLNFTASNAGTVAGPLLAGAVLASGSYTWAYGIDAALFTLVLYAALRLPPLPPQGEIGRPGLRSVWEGLRFITARPVLFMSFAVDIVAMLFAMPRALFPAAAEDRFGGGGAVGWLYAAIAIGGLAGGLFGGWIGRVRRQGVVLVGSIVVWGLFVAAAGLTSWLWLAVVLLAGAGAADLVSATFRQTILQVYAPDEMRGRLQGVFTVVVAGGPRLGDVRAGATAAVTGTTASWVAGGVACAVVVLLVAARVPAILRYRVDPAADAGQTTGQVPAPAESA